MDPYDTTDTVEGTTLGVVKETYGIHEAERSGEKTDPIFGRCRSITADVAKEHVGADPGVTIDDVEVAVVVEKTGAESVDIVDKIRGNVSHVRPD